jgi:hypothetical protein
LVFEPLDFSFDQILNTLSQLLLFILKLQMTRLVSCKLFVVLFFKLLILFLHEVKLFLHAFNHCLVMVVQRRYFILIYHHLSWLNKFVLTRLHLFNCISNLESCLRFFQIVFFKHFSKRWCKFIRLNIRNLLLKILRLWQM